MPFLPVCAVRPKFCAAWNVPSRCLARCLRCSSRSLQPGRAAPRHCNQPALCQRDVTGLEAHQPRALAEGHTAKTAQDFCCRDMEAISLCVPFAATRTRTGEVVLVPQTHRLAYNSPPWAITDTGTTSFQSCRFNPFLSG